MGRGWPWCYPDVPERLPAARVAGGAGLGEPPLPALLERGAASSGVTCCLATPGLSGLSLLNRSSS